MVISLITCSQIERGVSTSLERVSLITFCQLKVCFMLEIYDLAVEKNMFILSMSDHEDLSTGLQPKMMSYHHRNAISIVCIF